MKNYTASVTC